MSTWHRSLLERSTDQLDTTSSSYHSPRGPLETPTNVVNFTSQSRLEKGDAVVRAEAKKHDILHAKALISELNRPRGSSPPVSLLTSSARKSSARSLGTTRAVARPRTPAAPPLRMSGNAIPLQHGSRPFTTPAAQNAQDRDWSILKEKTKKNVNNLLNPPVSSSISWPQKDQPKGLDRKSQYQEANRMQPRLWHQQVVELAGLHQAGRCS